MKDDETREVFEVEVLKPKNLTNSAQSVKRDFAKYLTAEQINSVIGRMENAKDRMFIFFLWRSGVRVTEAISLTKADIDFTNRVVSVKWLKSRKYNKRSVPIHKELAVALWSYVASLNVVDRVFPFSRQRAFQIVQKYFGVGVSNHTFRHSFAVNWLRKGGDLITLHRILGHSKVQTTMEYLKIVPVDQARELDKISFD